jgi:hypothetical protein
MKKILLVTSIVFGVFSSSSFADSYYDSTTYGGNSPYYNSYGQDYSNDRGGNSPYYNSQNNDYKNYRGGNDSNYNAYDNSRGEVYGDGNSYRNSSGMIINR